MHEQMKNRLIVVLAALCVLLLVVAGWALATRSQTSGGAAPMYWVATDGNDAAPGTADEPWATLQKAADTVPAGALVSVRGGTYAQRVEFRVSGEPGRPITFAPAAGRDRRPRRLVARGAGGAVAR